LRQGVELLFDLAPVVVGPQTPLLQKQ
jgi:hypothetical protein